MTYIKNVNNKQQNLPPKSGVDELNPIWKFVIRYAIVIVASVFIIGMGTVMGKYCWMNVINEKNMVGIFWPSFIAICGFTIGLFIVVILGAKHKTQKRNKFTEYGLTGILMAILIFLGPVMIIYLNDTIKSAWKVTLDLKMVWTIFTPIALQAVVTIIAFLLISIPELASGHIESYNSYKNRNIAIGIGGGSGFVVALVYNIVIMSQNHFIREPSWFIRITMIVLAGLALLLMFFFSIKDQGEEHGDLYIRDGLFLPSILMGLVGTVIGIIVLIIITIIILVVGTFVASGPKTVGKGTITDSSGKYVGDVTIKEY